MKRGISKESEVFEIASRKERANKESNKNCKTKSRDLKDMSQIAIKRLSQLFKLVILMKNVKFIFTDIGGI